VSGSSPRLILILILLLVDPNISNLRPDLRDMQGWTVGCNLPPTFPTSTKFQPMRHKGKRPRPQRGGGATLKVELRMMCLDRHGSPERDGIERAPSSASTEFEERRDRVIWLWVWV
jgi:hypothetical protein